MNPLDKYYPLIGKVVVEFQDLEFALNIMLTALLKEDPNVVMALAVTLPFAKKLDVVKSIAPFKIRDVPLLDQLDGLIQKMTEAEECRNRIVHAAWIRSTAVDEVFYHKPRTSRKHGMKNGGIRRCSVVEVETVVTSIQGAKTHLFRFCALLEERNVIQTRMFGAINGKNMGNSQAGGTRHQ